MPRYPINPRQTTPIKARMSPSNPESPTTARELDFDDEVQEQGITPVLGSRAKSPSRQLSNEGAPPPPPKPPRPLSPRQQAENTLKEAFPSIDAAVVKAVLIASSYNIERSFHALLGTRGLCCLSGRADWALNRHVGPKRTGNRITAG